MELKNLRVLEGTDVLTKGDLENVTVTDDRIVLDSVAGRHVLFGCYTSQVLHFSAFDALVMSWNAETPEGTAVEAQARLMVDGSWTQWIGFGRWSPFIHRHSSPLDLGVIQLPRDVLYLDGRTSQQVQLRIYLYTDDEAVSPCVWMLGAGVRPVEPGPPPSLHQLGSRELRVPAYSQLLRAPAFEDAIALPSCLAGMMNRYGEDVLPEELALAMYDWEDHSCANLAFGAAVAGCWGYPCCLAFLDLWQLWQIVYSGNTVTIELSYAADLEEAAQGRPYWAGATRTTENHPVVVTGFENTGNNLMVAINDPLFPTDAQCARQIPLDLLLDGWDGIGLILKKKDRRFGSDKPHRRTVRLQKNTDSELDGNYLLVLNGQPHPLPPDFCGSAENPTGVLAATYADGVARATTAHKAFRFSPVVDGGIHLAGPGEDEKKCRRTVYAIDSSGSMLVGDVVL